MTTNTETIKSLAEFQKEIANLGDGEFVYRGQSNKKWTVISGAYRRLSKKEESKLSPDKLIKYHKDLISNVKNYDEASEIKTDLELLAQLEHFGSATSLIDFSHSALIALWFACQDSTEDGKVFCLDTDDPNAFLVITPQDQKEPIEKILELDLRENINIKTAKWQPPLSNNRIIKQDSVFIFNQSGKIEDTDFDKILTISHSHKVAIFKDLEKLSGITETRIFPDFYGFAQSNAYNKPYEAETAEEIFKRALDHHLAGELQEAIKDYGQVIELNEKHVASYYNRGVAKDSLGEFEEAIKDYSRAIELKPDYAIAYYNRGNAKVILEQFEEAIKDYSRAIELKPDYAIAYYNRGNAMADLEQFEEAIKDYSRAIELDPDDVIAYINRGTAKDGLKRFEEAIADFDQAVELKPDNAKAYYNRGSAKANLGRLEEAIKDFEQARDIFNKQGDIDQVKRCQEWIDKLKNQ